MIQRITIENFKGIREPVTLELKAITLLFGANASGKSTLLQALHYLCEIFLRRNLNPDETLLGGRCVELGGFRNFIHMRDTTEEIRFAIDLNWIEERPWPEINRDPDMPQDLYQRWRLWTIASAPLTVELTIRWSNLLKKPVVTRYAVKGRGQLFCEILSALDGKQVRLEKLNLSHHLLMNPDGDELLDLVEQMKGVNVIPLEEMSDSLPDFDGFIHVMAEMFEQGGDFPPNTVPDLEWLLTFLLVWPGRVLRNDLKNFRYIGPIREIPDRNHSPVRSPDPWRWASGLAAWDLLSVAPTELIDDVNAWLTGEDPINCGFSVHRSEVKDVDIGNPFLHQLLTGNEASEALSPAQIEALRDALSATPAKAKLMLFDEKRRLDVAPQETGVGMSQLLPVVTACVDPQSKVVAVEQPELHIHPALQARLGDLFIAMTQWQEVEGRPTRRWRKRLILETHSEHLILRLLRRVRESTEDKLPPGRGELGFLAEDLNVCYVLPGTAESGMQLKVLRVDGRGNFVDRWPNGFFDERLDEVI